MSLDSKPVLLLDLDDTLIPSEQIYKKAVEKLGLNLEKFRLARSAVKDKLPPRHVSARNRLLYLKNYFESDKSFSPNRVLEMMKRYEEILESECKSAWVSLKRDGLFSRLSKHYSFGLVTNENVRTQLIKVRAIDAHAQFFNVVVISEELGVEKPSPLLFLEAARRLGTDPLKVTYVGDSIENDIVPAKALGMRAILSTEFTEGIAAPNDKNTNTEAVKRLDEIEGLLT